MTPVQMSVLLHYFYRNDPFPQTELAYRDAAIFLKDNGLLEGVALTSRGDAYVELLKKVPLPVCKWVAP